MQQPHAGGYVRTGGQHQNATRHDLLERDFRARSVPVQARHRMAAELGDRCLELPEETWLDLLAPEREERARLRDGETRLRHECEIEDLRRLGRSLAHPEREEDPERRIPAAEEIPALREMHAVGTNERYRGWSLEMQAGASTSVKSSNARSKPSPSGVNMSCASALRSEALRGPSSGGGDRWIRSIT